MITPIKLDITIESKALQENNLCANVLEILKAVRPDWLQPSVFPLLKFKVFTGGISNQLYGYFQDGKFTEDVVLLRIYGAGTELFVDRSLEKTNIQFLHAAGRCAPLYAEFNNGIAYGFVNGVTLDEKLVRDETVRKLIAKEMIELHSLRPEGREVKPSLWDTLYKFLELSPDKLDDPDKQKLLSEKVKPKEVLRQEIDNLRDHIAQLDPPVVFCHNDLLLKNIVYDAEKGCVYFIDQEYAKYNYEHFDIANHFCEYAGVDTVDFSLYPDKAYQLEWLRYYLQQKAIHQCRNPDTVTDKDVEIAYVITNKFALAGHLFWGLWALVQEKLSTIDFGYLDYGRQKLEEYFARKEEFLGLKMPS